MKNTRFDESSLIKNVSNYSDHIHQSLIQIENEHPNEEEVRQLLSDSISYLDKDLPINAANELFSLILSCLSHYPNQILPLFSRLLETPAKNSYHIIFTAFFLSYLTRVYPQLSLTKHNSFIKDSLNQLLNQIQKNDENALKILDHQNLFLTTKLTKNLTSNTHSHNLAKNHLKSDMIFDDFLDDDRFVNDLSFESITNLSSHKCFNSKRSDQIFTNSNQTQNDGINDLQLYLNVFPSIRVRYPFLSTSKFWVHICSIASRSKESISRKMANQFHFYFERFVDEKKFDEVLNSIIFSKETQTSIGMEFITQMIFGSKPLIKQNYLWNVELNKLLSKILETKIVLKSCFWRLFSKNLIFKEFQKDTSNHLLLYGYEFAIGKFEHEINSIQMKPQTERSNIDLYDYIQNRNSDSYDVKENMQEEAVSLIASAFIFTRKEGNVNIEGLTKENVLPFLAICFDHCNNLCQKVETRNEVLIKILNFFKANQNFTLIKQACKSLKNNSSPLLVLSIDHLIHYLPSLLVAEFFSFNVCVEMIKILMKLLFNGNYMANKMSLLSTIFQFSTERNEQIDSRLLLLFQNNGIQLFEYIFKNLSQIIKYDELKGKQLSFDVFDESVSNFVVEKIENCSSVNDSIQFIHFIETFCVNTPLFKFKKIEIIDQILKETIQKEMKIESSLVYQFMLDNELFIDCHHLIEQPLLFSNLQQETIQKVDEALFQKMIENKSIATNYLIILLQKAVKNSCTNNLNAEQILKLYSKEFNQFNDTFINAVDSLFIFYHKTNKFVMKTDFEFTSSSLFAEEFSFVSNLLKLANSKQNQLNALFILHSLSSTFPFIFDGLSHQIFEIVLKAFNDNKQNEKVTDVASSFLLSAVKQPKILDDFISWFFSNTQEFSESQIQMFFVVFNELIKIDSIKSLLLSQLIKHDFLETVLKIMTNDLDENSLTNISNFTMIFINSLRSMTQKDAVLIDELMKVEKLFQTVFGHSLIHFENLQFESQLNSVKPFWISFDFEKRNNEEPKEDQLTDFLYRFSSQKAEYKRSKIVSHVQLPLTTSMIRYLATKPAWISMWIEKPESFVLVSEHTEILSQIVSDLNSIKQRGENKIDMNFDKFEKREKLFIEFIMKATNTKSDSKPFLSICELFKEVAQKEDDFLSLLKSASFCVKKSTSADSIQRITDILTYLSNLNKVLFVENFALICGNDIIESILTHKFKSNDDLLLKITKLFSSIDQKHIPNRIIEFISFIIADSSDPNIISKSLFLCSKLDETTNKQLNSIVQSLLDKSIDIESDSLTCLPAILEQFPSIGKSRNQQLLSLLDQLLIHHKKVGNSFTTIIKEEKKQSINQDEKKKQMKKCNNEENKARACNMNCEEEDKRPLKKLKKNDDKKHSTKEKKQMNNIEDSQLLLDLIGSLFNFTAPKRNQPRTIDQKPSSESEIPTPIFDLSPDFWELFSKHRGYINDTIAKRPILLGSTFSFLLNFPELLDYETRYSYFAESRHKIAKGNVLELTVRQTSILTDSFNLLNSLSATDLIRNLRIKFHGETETVQNEVYFSLLAKEIFDPRNYFFVYTEDRKSLQINPRSNVIRKHIDYFKFAGKMLARAILEDQTFNISITPSIYKILLKRPFDITDLKDVDKELFTQLKQKLDEDDTNDTKSDKKSDDGVFFTLGFDDEEEEEEESNDDENSSTIESKENRNQMYVDSKIEHRLHEPIIDQANAFCDGFYQIIPFEQIRAILPDELNRLFCGLNASFSCSFNEFIENIQIAQPFSSESPTIKAFLDAASSWEDDRFSQLLLFVTKSNRYGFKQLNDNGNPLKIAVSDEINIPQSLPFVNLLLLPICEDKSLMDWKFLIAFNEIDSKLPASIRKVRGKKKNTSNVND